MKKLLLFVALLSLPVIASAGDTLLTPTGTLFTIDTEVTSGPVDITTVADSHLFLTLRQGTETKKEMIPATLVDGSHTDATMAYDADSGMLFVFWIHSKSITGSELLFASRDANGAWSEPTQFGGRVFDLRKNLRIAVTRKYYDEDEKVLRSGISVHAAWWEWDTHLGEWFAQYQMLTIVNGVVAEAPAALDLREIARADMEPATETVTSDALSQPLLFTSPKQDSVLVVFGDEKTQKIHEVRVNPFKAKAEGRLRVPVGRREGASTTPTLVVAPQGRMEGLYGDNDRMAFFTTDKDALRYVVMKDGAWSESQQITLDSQITAGAAVDALRRLVSEH
ncbi:MAG: hypothetical protein ACTHQM_24090 [Thermoanaerobaculia bacterium]